MAYTEGKEGHDLVFTPGEPDGVAPTFVASCSCGDWVSPHVQLAESRTFAEGRMFWAMHVARANYQDTVTEKIMVGLEAIAITDPVTGTRQVALDAIEADIAEQMRS